MASVDDTFDRDLDLQYLLVSIREWRELLKIVGSKVRYVDLTIGVTGVCFQSPCGDYNYVVLNAL